MSTNRPDAGGQMPQMSFAKFGGGELSVGGPRERYTLFVVYRGKHCGRCKKYLAILDEMRGDWEAAGFDVVVVSAYPLEMLQADVYEFGWTFDVGHDLSEAQMRELGVYISDPLSPDETDRRFAEPAIFCVRPDGVIQIVCLSNGPAARPELAELLDGMKFNIAHNRPARGTA